MNPFLSKWLPVILWASAIFFFSTGNFSSANTSGFVEIFLSWLFPAKSAEQLEIVHYGVRKFGHFSEYFIFALLLVRALADKSLRRLGSRTAIWILIIVVAYATIDELHQSFVPTRSALASDVFIDFFGGFCAVLIVRARWHRRET